MKEVFAAILIFLCVVAVMLGMMWLIEGNNFFLYRYFGPKNEDVRREVFEHSRAFKQGMVQELENMQFQYEQADPGHRDALADLMLHRAADVDESTLTTDLVSFLARLRAERHHSSKEIR